MSAFRSRVNAAKEAAGNARDNLTIKVSNKHFAKVCCICDRFIPFLEEKLLEFGQLVHDNVLGSLGKNCTDFAKLGKFTIKAKRDIEDYYVPKCINHSQIDIQYRARLKKLWLSPRSYIVEARKKSGFGCCNLCKNYIVCNTLSSTRNSSVPKYSIANGLMIGQAPDVLSSLNEVELALISLARIDKHVFSIVGGSHTQMKGWHTMYVSDVSNISRTVNWCSDHLDILNQETAEGNYEEISIESDSDNDDTLDEDDSDIEEKDGEENIEVEKLKFPSVCVILAGPFTPEQAAFARKRTEVRWEKIKNAFKWLKKNNRCYQEHDIDISGINKPVFLEKIESVASVNSNIEKNLEFCAIFPDGSNANSNNGGFVSRSGFKEVTLERLRSENGDTSLSILSRPTKNILRDYEGDNLMKAFPLQFPYGIGSTDAQGTHFWGENYLRHLSYLSSKQYHRGDFLCVLHNMFERSKMIRSAYIRHGASKGEDYTTITPDEMKEAIEKYMSGHRGNTIADRFLQSMKTTTSDMSHTNGAAQKARQKVFALMTKFGFPVLMLTFTPVDEHNFRIRIMRHTERGECDPPALNSSDEILREYLINCRDIRRDYPGFCALDYENVKRIVIHCILGWDTLKNEPQSGVGIFGDVQAYVVATEEQGRKTLHGHVLVWVKEWASLFDKLGTSDNDLREMMASNLKKFAESIMTANIFGSSDDKIIRPCPESCSLYGRTGLQNMEACTIQGVRNLRSQKGITEFGNKCIVKCTICNNAFTSEDFAVAFLSHKFGKEKIATNGVIPRYNDDFWEKNYNPSKCFVYMEHIIMRSLLPHSDQFRNTSEEQQQTKVCVAIARNLHKSEHVKKCFKKKGESECRMKIPNEPSDDFDVKFEEKNTKWFSWNGTENTRKIFSVVPQRSIVDVFANVHNETISSVFGCNSNVVGCVDGGSIMYITSYHSKNTQDEDSSQSTKAATHMINRLREKLRDNDQDGVDVDKHRLGLSSLIGAVLMSTTAHTCSSPMAAYLVRNRSRFQFSHDTEFVSLTDFTKFSRSDYALNIDEHDNPYFMSCVANYKFRPVELNDICLYDFVERYTIAPTNADSFEWFGDHPSGNRRKVRERKCVRIPLINFLDFVDTRTFGGLDMLRCPLDIQLPEHQFMEQYAEKACLAFVPFRDVDKDLLLDGSYLLKFRKYFEEGRLSSTHINILQNMQNCRNSFNAGRPNDNLEKQTVNQYCSETANQVDWEDDGMGGVMNTLFQEDSTFEYFSMPNYRDGDNLLNFKSQLTSGQGRNIHIPKIAIGECDTVITTADVEPPSVHGLNEPEIATNVDGNASFDLATNFFELHMRNSEVVTDDTTNLPIPLGTRDNLEEYADALFRNDQDQKTAFVCISAAFVITLLNKAKTSGSYESMPRSKKQKLARHQNELFNLVRNGQLICLLCGAGGTGKSFVIKSVVGYAKKLCQQLKMEFNSRTIVVTALTGCAAISIRGETLHAAAKLNHQKIEDSDIDAYKSAIMIIIDEISLAGHNLLTKLNTKLKELKGTERVFGGVHVVFAGDFSQLDPVLSGKPIYKEKIRPLWDDYVKTFFELKTNHRFKDDKPWGALLDRCHGVGLTSDDVKQINKRVIGSPRGPKESDIPSDAVYATATNEERMVINDLFFAKHLKDTHWKNLHTEPPKHTICIKACDLEWKESRSSYRPMHEHFQDILFACCGEYDVVSSHEEKMYAPLLKLYYGRPMMVNDNIDVGSGIANGTMCAFESVQLVDGKSYNDLEKIVIDGYYVWCVSACDVKHLVLRNLDMDNEIINLKLWKHAKAMKANYPVPIYGQVQRDSLRTIRQFRMKQFPLNAANARTLHKLQGRSITNIVIHSWIYGKNWVYVALSRVTTSKGLFLRRELEIRKMKTRAAALTEFMKKMRTYAMSIPERYY